MTLATTWISYWCLSEVLAAGEGAYPQGSLRLKLRTAFVLHLVGLCGIMAATWTMQLDGLYGGLCF